MQSARVKKGTEDTGHSQNSSGRSMPAVPVSQKKEAPDEQEAIQKKDNQTGLPDNLKSGIENLSGMSMNSTRVHYNSDKPAQLNAHAYAQGTDIHVGPGQEQHLPHEAWHVVQQAQGRVKPTMQMKSGVPINDDTGLEHEADVMGSKAVSAATDVGQMKSKSDPIIAPAVKVAQLAGTKPNQPSMSGQYRIKLSSEREAFTYNNRVALGLDDVLPGSHKVIDKMAGIKPDKLHAVKIEGNPSWVVLAKEIPWPADNQEVLCIDTVGWENERDKPVEERDKKCVMDIKIGTYTKSTEQFALEGAGIFKRFFKRIEHDMKDSNRANRQTGYDIDAADLVNFTAAYNNPRSRGNIKLAMAALQPKLAAIKTRMATAPITFVGSSLFIVFNITTPESSDVKLIDPDHPIVTDAAGLNMPDQLIKKRNFDGQTRTWDQYITKWKGSFGTGMDNFLAWFNMTAAKK